MRTTASTLARVLARAAGGVYERTAQPRAPAPPHPERTATPDVMLESWTVDGEWLVSPRLDAPDGATRVGALVGPCAAG